MSKSSPIQILRHACETEVVTDSQVAALWGSGPAGSSKLSRMVKAGELLRVKRGLYVFSGPQQKSALNIFSLANLVYGPSYVSLESALSFYQMIPEAVREITSVNLKKPKLFRTPVGRFTYRCIPKEAFAFEVSTIGAKDQGHGLIGSPEKALLDKCYLDGPRTNLAAWLTESLRIEEEKLRDLRHSVVRELSSLYNSQPFFNAVSSLLKEVTP